MQWNDRTRRSPIARNRTQHASRPSPPPIQTQHSAQHSTAQHSAAGPRPKAAPVAALGHVALDLPRKLDLIADVEVDLEVDQVAHALIEEGVEALDHQDLGVGGLGLGGGGFGVWSVAGGGGVHSENRFKSKKAGRGVIMEVAGTKALPPLGHTHTHTHTHTHAHAHTHTPWRG